MRFLYGVFLSFIMLSACSGEWDSYPPAQEKAVFDNLIHESDTLSVNIYDEPSLSGDFTVDTKGMIAMPLIGMVSAANLEAQFVANSIEKAFKKGGYLVNPDVTVTISRTRSFSVIGEVLNSGEYSFQDGMTVLDAIAKAGGFSYRAQQSEFDLVRKTREGSEEVIEATLSTKIRAKDVIRIRERFF